MMGSVGEYAKGAHPAIKIITDYARAHGQALRNRMSDPACPRHLTLLWLVGEYLGRLAYKLREPRQRWLDGRDLKDYWPRDESAKP